MLMKALLLTFVVNLVLVATLSANLCNATSATYLFTKSPQLFAVPKGVTRVTVWAAGAATYDAYSQTNPGLGGIVEATIHVTPGEVLGIFVGSDTPYSEYPQHGFNGGGWPRGGDASDVRQGGLGLEHRIVVAGGAGGGAYPFNVSRCAGNGGPRSDACNSTTEPNGGGRGGSSQLGGAPGSISYGSPGEGERGSFGFGGNAATNNGGGGGGGWHGGGAGYSDGTDSYSGGGGSNYLIPTATSILYQSGAWNSTYGKVILTWLAATTTIMSASNSGTSVTLTAQVEPSDYRLPTPTGTVSFYEGATRLGTSGSLDTSGRYTVVRNMTSGTHQLRAIYLGDTVAHERSSSAVVTIVIP